MATSVSHYPQTYTRNNTPVLALAAGIFLMILGLIGVLDTEFMGLHLSAMHSLILNVSGVITIWAATLHDLKTSSYVSLCLAVFYLIFGLTGVVMDRPHFLDLTAFDHALHLLMSVFFFALAYSFPRQKY